MRNLSHLTPIIKKCCAGILPLSFARTNGRHVFLLRYIEQFFPEIQFNYEAAFPINPKDIPKVKNKSYRKALYQSYSLYKKSFKPKPQPKLKVIWNEWGKIAESAKNCFNDIVDAMSYAFANISWDSLKDFNGPKKHPDYAEFKGIKVKIDKGECQK